MATEVSTVVADAKSVVAQVEGDLAFVKANWLKVNLILIAAGLAGFIVGQIIRI